MKPEDDPEVRIRELERSLSEQARASEITVPSTDQRRSRPVGRRVVRGVLALAVPAAAAGLFFGGDFLRTDHPASSHSPTTARPSRAGSPAGDTVIISSTVLVGPTQLVPPADAVTPTEDSDELLTISGAGVAKSVACHDNAVSISGISNTVTITGPCTSLTISGIDNAVVLDTAEQIVVSGLRNHVTYHSGSPEIVGANASNASNVVVQG